MDSDNKILLKCPATHPARDYVTSGLKRVSEQNAIYTGIEKSRYRAHFRLYHGTDTSGSSGPAGGFHHCKGEEYRS